MTIRNVDRVLEFYEQLSEKNLLDRPEDVFLRMTKEGALSCEKRRFSCCIHRVIAFFSKKNPVGSECDFVRNLREVKFFISKAIYEVRGEEEGWEVVDFSQIDRIEKMIEIYNKMLTSKRVGKTISRFEAYKIKHLINDESTSLVTIREIVAPLIKTKQIIRDLERVANNEQEKKALFLLCIALAAKKPEIMNSFAEFSGLYDDFIRQETVLSEEDALEIKRRNLALFLGEIKTSESLLIALPNATIRLKTDFESVKQVVAKVFEEKKKNLQCAQEKIRTLREQKGRSRQKIEIEKPFSREFLFTTFDETVKIEGYPSIEGIRALNKKIAEIEIHIECEEKKEKLCDLIGKLDEIEDLIHNKEQIKYKNFDIEVDVKNIKSIALAVAQEISGDFNQIKVDKLNRQISFVEDLVKKEKKRFADLDEKINCLERMNATLEQKREQLSEWDKSSATAFIQEGKQKLYEFSAKIKHYKSGDLSGLEHQTKDIVETYSDENVQKAIKKALEEENKKTLSSLEAVLDLERKKGLFSGVVSWFSGKSISDQEYAVVDLFAKASSSVFWNNILHRRSSAVFDEDASLRAKILKLITIGEKKIDLQNVREILEKFKELEKKNTQLQSELEASKEEEFFAICGKKNVMEGICGDIKFIDMLRQKSKWPDKDKRHLPNFLAEKKRLDSLSEGIGELDLTYQEARWNSYLDQLFNQDDLNALHERGIDRYKDIERIKRLVKI